ncbi:MAG TPA: LysR substrate-binding domain-containing protein [Oculatellaceae cyanobacterium]
MELRHLRYFIRAAELLHFTRAAESLYISQPSLSIHIQQLEEELKTKLFSRVGRSVHLTESGQVLLARAKNALNELEEAGKEIEAMTGLLGGTLSVATVPLYGSRLMPKWLDVFSNLHPLVHVNVRAMRAEDIEAGLLAGVFDLGISLAPPEHTELLTTHILSDNIVLVAANDHPLAKKKTLVVDDLVNVVMALPSHKISSTRYIGAYFEAVNIRPNCVIEQDDGHALLELVKLGGFITFLPRRAIGEDVNLCIKDLPPPGIPMSVAAMYTQLNPASTAFLDVALAEQAAALVKLEN